MIAKRLDGTLSVSFLVLTIGTLVFSSCSSKTQEPPSGTIERVISSTPPFKTREPKDYRAVRTTTFTDSSGKSITTKMLIARSEDRRREESAEGAHQLVILNTGEGRFVLIPEMKIYAEMSDDAIAGSTRSDSTGFENSPERLLHIEPLATSYEKLGFDTISGRNATKYRVLVNTSPGENVTSSESLMWIDETIGMPIRSETKASDGSRTLMEISDIMLDVDKSLFQIPEGYEKVTATEMRRRLGRN